jgi:hypothetical protein
MNTEFTREAAAGVRGIRVDVDYGVLAAYSRDEATSQPFAFVPPDYDDSDVCTHGFSYRLGDARLARTPVARIVRGLGMLFMSESNSWMSTMMKRPPAGASSGPCQVHGGKRLLKAQSGTMAIIILQSIPNQPLELTLIIHRLS